MSRTNFNFGGWPRISWTACPFSVGSCLCPQVAHSFCLAAHFARRLWFPWVFLFYERACQEQTSTSAAGQGFHGQLAPSPSGVASVPKLLTAFVSPLISRGGCGSLGCSCSMKGHVKNKLQLRRLAKDFMDSLPLLRRELPLSPSCSQLLSRRSFRAAAVVPLGVPVL